jgi:hypothetical protein
MPVRRIQPSLEAYEAEEADFGRVLAATERIAAATEAELRDLDWVFEVVCSAGLAVLDALEETYGELAQLVTGSHQGLSQYPLEYARWLHLLGQHRVQSYVEIGCYNGNAACLAAAYLSRFAPGFRAVTIDLFPSFLFHEVACARLPLEYRVRTTSFDLRGERFDAAFIDGDHTFDWAMADYQNVGRQARFCGIHDICSELYYDTQAYGGVTGAWEWVCRREGGPGVEFLEICEHPLNDRFGIGVRMKPGLG